MPTHRRAAPVTADDEIRGPLELGTAVDGADADDPPVTVTDQVCQTGGGMIVEVAVPGRVAHDARQQRRCIDHPKGPVPELVDRLGNAQDFFAVDPDAPAAHDPLGDATQHVPETHLQQRVQPERQQPFTAEHAAR